MKLTDRHTGRLQGQTSLELMTGETPDISEYLDFGWYNRARFNEGADLRETHTGKFLGPSHKYGSLMSYWILSASGILVSRKMV